VAHPDRIPLPHDISVDDETLPTLDLDDGDSM